jgi:hypothetical protein
MAERLTRLCQNAMELWNMVAGNYTTCHSSCGGKCGNIRIEFGFNGMMRWVRHVACTEYEKCVQDSGLVRPRHRWQNIIRMDLK